MSSVSIGNFDGVHLGHQALVPPRREQHPAVQVRDVLLPSVSQHAAPAHVIGQPAAQPAAQALVSAAALTGGSAAG